MEGFFLNILYNTKKLNIQEMNDLPKITKQTLKFPSYSFTFAFAHLQ